MPSASVAGQMIQANPYQSPEAVDFVGSLDGIALPRTERVRIDADVLVDAHFARYGARSSLVIRIMALLIALPTLLIFFMNLWAVLNTPRAFIRILFFTVGFIGTFLLVWGVLGNRINRWLLKSWYALTRRTDDYIEYEFSRDRVTAKSARGILETRWDDIRKWRVHGDVVLAWYRRNKFLTFPTSRFTAETRELIDIVRR